MTLAERIAEHCTASRQAERYGSLLGFTFPLRAMLRRWLGVRVQLADGVEAFLPRSGCTWQTFDQSDGGVKLAFTGALPLVTAKVGPIPVSPEITELVIRIGAAAIELQAMLKTPKFLPDAPFTLTIPLRGDEE